MLQVEKWGIFEVTCNGKNAGNPFLDYSITGHFKGEKEDVTVDGFYDGDGTYKVRFMPSYEGVYTYQIFGTYSDVAEEGTFKVVAPYSKNNHGRVCVVDERHLGYEDGTAYYSIGTTCYAWIHQSMELQEQTLETLADAPFNKMRFCMFPKYYSYNYREPITHPYERGSGEGIDPILADIDANERILFPGMQPPELDYNFNYYRPNVEHYKRFDLRIKQLMDLGIEADIILMHPYDRWGINAMNKECCDLYIRYMVARYGAYRNVWWSLANEYDIMPTKQEEDWERYAAIICEKDPYIHLRSIHNCMKFYDYSRPWVTHCSMQRVDFYRHVEYTDEYMEKYNKPVVWDEIGYEGNIPLGWGNLTGPEMVRRFWEAFLRGGHAGHGETFLDPNDILWWSHGGPLKGESVPRLKFLLEILKELPAPYLRYNPAMFDETAGASVVGEMEKPTRPFEIITRDYEIHYLGINQPAARGLILPEDKKYHVDVIDTWEMTIEDRGIVSGYCEIPMPQKPYMAIRIIKVEE